MPSVLPIGPAKPAKAEKGKAKMRRDEMLAIGDVFHAVAERKYFGRCDADGFTLSYGQLVRIEDDPTDDVTLSVVHGFYLGGTPFSMPMMEVVREVENHDKKREGTAMMDIGLSIGFIREGLHAHVPRT